MQILCVNKTYVKNSAKEPGKAAEIRENVKIKIYENLSDHNLCDAFLFPAVLYLLIYRSKMYL